MLEKNKIYNMDCLQGMSLLPDKSINMILCDLPYAMTKLSWDSLIPLDALWEQYNRIIKDCGAGSWQFNKLTPSASSCVVSYLFGICLLQYFSTLFSNTN